MEEMLKEFGLGDFQEKFETYACVQAYKEGGFKGLYEDTLRDKKEAKKLIKKDEGKDFDETRFEVGYIESKIDHVIKLLHWIPIKDSTEDRKAIADELTRLAEELRNL